MINFCKLKIFIIFFISTVLFSGCFPVKPLTIGEIQDFRIDDISAKDISVSFRINVKNQNNFNIIVTKVKLKASIDNKVIGKVTKVNRIIIPPDSKQFHEISAKIQLPENNNNISDLLQLSLKRPSLKFDGYIKVRTFMFSRKIPVEDKNIMKLLNN